MGSQTHLGAMVRDDNANAGPQDPKRYLEVTSSGKSVFLRIGKKTDNEDPMDVVGIILDESGRNKFLEALYDAMHRAGQMEYPLP